MSLINQVILVLVCFGLLPGLAIGVEQALPNAQPPESGSKPPATQFLSHRMGESFQEWLGSSGIDIEQICAPYKDPKNPWSRKPRMAQQLANKCRALSGIRDTGNGEYIEGATREFQQAMERLGMGDDVSFERPYVWTFRGGVLARLVLYKPNTQRDIEFLTEKYGAPATHDIVPYQNGFGAKWECVRAYWKMPDGTTILAEESMEGLTRYITVAFSSKEMVAELERQPKAPNPY